MKLPAGPSRTPRKPLLTSWVSTSRTPNSRFLRKREPDSSVASGARPGFEPGYVRLLLEPKRIAATVAAETAQLVKTRVEAAATATRPVPLPPLKAARHHGHPTPPHLHRPERPPAIATPTQPARGAIGAGPGAAVDAVRLTRDAKLGAFLTPPHTLTTSTGRPARWR